ncbi:MAG: DNA topoisomerase IV subunit A [Planctomycetes bacterium]|nr:DNA topoisomerase IV subunit A [Planctomycetota bacterium]MCB9892644.1 DNA topoisomerase IV subunit A [Planctomycetota bacterium]MCB9919361.1 DNA topoisomerase IV subunit A [Planctomycetota bacterium]
MAAKKKAKKAATKRATDVDKRVGTVTGVRTKAQQDLDKKTVEVITEEAKRVHDHILQRKKPDLVFPVRSLGNVRYDKKVGYFELGRGRKRRNLTFNSVKNFAQMLRMMATSKTMVEINDAATKREAYYNSKNWGDAKFKEQTESDTVMDDIEAMFSLHGITREQLRFKPAEHGGSVAGNIVIIDRDLETGDPEEIDCTRMGRSAWRIPAHVEHLDFRTDADFVLAIETNGTYERLATHKFWREYNCILIEMGGVPTRACRRFIRLLADKKKIPVYAFVDCDPYGIANIYRSLKVGSGNAAHINQFFCVPQAQFLGVTPQDIIDYQLREKDAVHRLGEIDIKRAKDALKNDPFFQSHKEWTKAIQLLLKMGVRAEQQAFAAYDLNFVIREYLPEKLKKKSFLP